MKILHVFKQYYPYHQGGIEHVIDRLSVYGSLKGFEVEVVTLTDNYYHNNVYYHNKIKVTGLSEIKFLKNLKIGTIRSIFEYIKIVKNFDIVVFHAPWPFINILSFLTYKKIKQVLFYHSDLVNKGILGYLYNKYLLSYLINNKNLIIFTSNLYRKTSKLIYQSSTRTAIVPLGVTCTENLDNNIEENKKISEKGFVLFLGSLREYKGLKYLLQAASYDNSINYVIAGNGVCKHELLKIKSQLDLKNVKFIEKVDDEMKKYLLNSCHALVLPSINRAEAFGIVILEAMACSKPVISTEIGTATSEINIDGITGYVVKPMSAVSLFNGIVKIMSNDEIRLKMGQAAKKRVSDDFSEKMMFEKFHKELFDIVNDNS